MSLKMSFSRCWPFSLGLNVLKFRSRFLLFSVNMFSGILFQSSFFFIRRPDDTIVNMRNCADASNMMTSSNGNIFHVTGPLCGEFLSQRPVTRRFDFFICAWINDWVNNREAGDLRCHRAHYDVIVMTNYWTETKGSEIDNGNPGSILGEVLKMKS